MRHSNFGMSSAPPQKWKMLHQKSRFHISVESVRFHLSIEKYQGKEETCLRLFKISPYFFSNLNHLKQRVFGSLQIFNQFSSFEIFFCIFHQSQIQEWDSPIFFFFPWYFPNQMKCYGWWEKVDKVSWWASLHQSDNLCKCPSRSFTVCWAFFLEKGYSKVGG